MHLLRRRLSFESALPVSDPFGYEEKAPPVEHPPRLDALCVELGSAPPDNPRFQRGDVFVVRIEIVIGQVLQVAAVAAVPVAGMLQHDAAARCGVDDHTALMDGILL